MKIFYGICGEGMGHAGRSIALVERLAALGHRVRIFTFADGFQLLEKAGFQPQRIIGLQFKELPNGNVDALGTAGNFRRYMRQRQESLDLIHQLALAENPDLFITDFEPLTALAAATVNTALVSLDNQHLFCHPLDDCFPLYLRLYGQLAGAFVRWWIKQSSLNIVTAFHRCSPSRKYRSVNAMIREKLTRLTPTAGDHVLIYCRELIGQRITRMVAGLSQKFIVYGCQGPPAANLVYKPPSYEGFAADLASCQAVICLAGQQLLGEARFFGKPVLAIPLPNQHEQEINARYLRQEQIGDFCPIGSLRTQRIQKFLRQRASGARPANGVDQVLDLLRIGYG